ncbi:phosphonate ABC transporter, permease protein PhnE [Demequina sp. SYSU T00068]|uniref:phosphonate ABC transporter, permease protein PhnE n=1 Tax=Demequina lignilytica TaxID=3051663 RepID=UPI002608CC1B|nr:phosphonate ABC transporter, permease protein PhnE [Demequina sp. SYSU T00068]MDN4489705.1 phosphonate ABC transporter, permease protein PhnE [Demequina sp. SYSU T00068]
MTATSAGAPAPSRPRKPPVSRPLVVGLLITAAITVWAAWEIDFTLRPLFTDFANGWVVVEQFLRPNWAYLGRSWNAWVETISIALVASFFGIIVGLVLAYMASKVTNRSNALYRATKWFLAVLRSLPDVAYVLIFVALVGVGSLAGILALFIFNIGIAAKLTAETIDAVEPGPLEAADASGAGTFSRARWAVQPQILPNFLSYALYIFELNIRSSVVIGYAGGGGIGQLIQVQFARFNYENVSAIVISMFVVVLIIDQVSQYLRRRLV